MYRKYVTILLLIIAGLLGGCAVAAPSEQTLEEPVVSAESADLSAPNPQNVPVENVQADQSTDTVSADILPEVQFTDEYAESSEDTNQDGLLDSLNIDIGVSVPEAGYYTIGATLETGQPARVPQAIDGIQVRPYLEAGPQMVRLTFAGKYIRLSKFDGSYLLSQLWVTDVENPTPIQLRTNLLDSRIKSYETSTYEHMQFQAE